MWAELEAIKGCAMIPGVPGEISISSSSRGSVVEGNVVYSHTKILGDH